MKKFYNLRAKFFDYFYRKSVNYVIKINLLIKHSLLHIGFKMQFVTILCSQGFSHRRAVANVTTAVPSSVLVRRQEIL